VILLAPFLLSAALTQTAAAPPPTRRRGYMQTLLLASYHPAASTSYHRESPNLRGIASAVSVAVGRFLSRSLALEGEFVYGQTVSAPQQFSYFSSEEYRAGSRDLLFNELLRYRPGGRAPVEIVVGGGHALTTVSEKSIVYRSGTPTTISHPPDRSRRQHALSLTAGVDGTVRISQRLSFTPGFRFRWIHRPDTRYGGTHGIARYALEFGAGIRLW
jgi:hypothetical protein